MEQEAWASPPDLDEPDGDDGDWFRFELGQYVRIVISGEVGVVMARTQNFQAADSYTVEYASNHTSYAVDEFNEYQLVEAEKQ